MNLQPPPPPKTKPATLPTSPAPRPVGVSQLADVPGLQAAADIEPLWRMADLTRVLNCSRRVVERMRAAGRLPKPDLFVGNRSPRWKPATIRVWIDGQAPGGWPMRNDLSALDTALELLRRGLWPVVLYPLGATIPTKDGPKTATGKEPIGLAWGKTRPTKADLRRLFGQNPDAGVGIMLGPAAGVVDLEVDGTEGEESLKKLFGGELVETLGWSSRRGPHRLFGYDPRLAALGKTKITLPQLPGLEIRLGSDEAQLQSAVPPTIGEDGQPRQWNDVDTIAELSEAALLFLENALAERRPEAKNGDLRVATVPPPSNPAAAWFRKAMENEAGKVATARDGERHDTLLAAARTLGGMLHHGYLTEADVTAELTHAGRRAGLPDREIAETIRDGLANGKAAPLPWPDKLNRPSGATRNGQHHAPGPAEPEPWPPMQLGELPSSPSFPVDVFPVALRTYCLEAAAALSAPVDFVGAAMLATAGAAVGQSMNIKIKRGWTEAPLLYLILVARPGKTKTPAIRTVVKPLTEIDRRLRQESLAARQVWEAAKKAHEKKPRENPAPGPEPPQCRAIVKDITRESLVIILKDNPRGVLCDPDEASGWVASFNEYKGKGGSDRQFWLSVWSCAPVSVDRKGGRESTYVPHPFVGVIGGMPPAMLSNLTEERGRDDGFLDRCLFVFPDDSAFPTQRWTKAELSEATERDWAETVTRLHAMPMVVDPDAELPRPFYVRFTPEAERLWAEWFDAHADESEAPDFPDDLAGAWSKMKAYAARFALILSRLWLACDPTADPQTGSVGAPHARGAVSLVTYFKAQAERARHEMTGGVGSTDAKAVLSWIRGNRKTTFREADVSADHRRFRTNPRALAAALRSLVGVGVIRPRAEARPAGPGRTGTPLYEVHPDIAQAPENTENTGNASDHPAAPPISGIFGISGRVQDDEANGREVIEL
jgi:hypothetical protein